METAPEAWRIAARLEVHHAKDGSWLDMAEIELSAPSRDLPERIGDGAAMVRHVAAWEGGRDQAGVKAAWQFTADDARTKLLELYPTIDE